MLNTEWVLSRDAPTPMQSSAQIFTAAEILAVAIAHNVIPNGINYRGEDVVAAWEAEMDDMLDQVNRSAALLADAPTVKTERACRSSSYGLKHALEGCYRHLPGGGYICNGAAIVACILVGVPIWKSDDPRDPNVMVGISKRHMFPGERAPGIR